MRDPCPYLPLQMERTNKRALAKELDTVKEQVSVPAWCRVGAGHGSIVYSRWLSNGEWVVIQVKEKHHLNGTAAATAHLCPSKLTHAHCGTACLPALTGQRFYKAQAQPEGGD